MAAPAAAQSFRLGSLRLVALRDGGFNAPNDGKVLGVDAGPEAVARVLASAGAPTDTIALSVNALLVRSAGHTVLIDTGLGPNAHGGLLASLAKAGVAPGDVTDILITHSHGDHVGGLLTAAGASAFPKAAVRMAASEWEWMRSQAGGRAIASAISPQVRTFAPGARVLPGITSIAITGHTPGHVGYEIASGGSRLLDIGDTAHSYIVSLAQPGWAMGFDNDRAEGRRSREATLARLARSHELVFSPHFPFPGVGHVIKAGEGYRWQPADLPLPVIRQRRCRRTGTVSTRSASAYDRPPETGVCMCQPLSVVVCTAT